MTAAGPDKSIALPPMPQIAARPSVLFFVGSGRTGSTLLGTILNHHPQCLIANEARVLARILSDPSQQSTLLHQAAESAWTLFCRGIENDAHFGPTLAHYQPHWQSFHDLSEHPACIKRQVRVIGDKKAGGNTQAMQADPTATRELLESSPETHLLHVVRDPIMTARSAMRALGAEDFRSACEAAVSEAVAAATWCGVTGQRAYRVSYEKLCREPLEEISSILQFLGLHCDAQWISTVGARISPGTPSPATTQERTVCEELIREYGAAELFEASMRCTDLHRNAEHHACEPGSAPTQVG